jgi:two-component system OmpR family response regulator
VKNRILIVEDDSEVATTTADILATANYLTFFANAGSDAIEQVKSSAFDLVLLDLTLPDMDGLDVLRHLERRRRMGVIILSGRDNTIDRVLGLELGADDYVTKPFEPRELLARVRSVLRRCELIEEEDNGLISKSFGKWNLDLRTHEIHKGDEARVPLTPSEFRLLAVLADHPNRILSRESIMDLLYRNDSDAPFDRSIDVTINRLRRKLEDDPTRPKYIKTMRGEGYWFDTSAATPASPSG